MGGNLPGATIATPDGVRVEPDADGRFVVPAQLAPGAQKFTASLPDRRSGSREVVVENTSLGLFSESIADGVLTFVATGLRNQLDRAAFAVLIDDQAAEILLIEPSAITPGIDTVQVTLPAGASELDVVLTVDGKSSNTLHVLPL